MKALFIGAHTDDIEHGAGGLFCKLLGDGHDVRYLVFSRCTDLPRNRGIADDVQRLEDVVAGAGGFTRILDLENRRLPEQAETVREALEDEASECPHLVVTHWSGDIHQDHRTVAEESLRVFRNSNVLSYPCLRSCPGFQANFYVDLSAKNVEAKISLLALYRTQASLYYNRPEVHRSLAVVRGAECGRPFAEGYNLVRMVVGADKCALSLLTLTGQ